MAAIPAFINLSFISNYAGQHRVCYRIQGDPSYTCTQVITPHPTCPGGGSPCGYQISITVDNETCDPVTYEGYVQPVCYEEESLSGRTPFLVTFTPAPVCKRWLLTCPSAGVASLNLLTGGDGYNPLSPPAIVLAGDGIGATATATVGGGIISALSIDNAGVGYSDGVYVGVALTGGSGVGATADVTISGGIVTIVAINIAGTGYQDTDVLALDTGTVGVPSTPVQLGPTTDYGIIIALNLTAPGSGYTTPPTVVIPPPVSGTIATGSAELDVCAGPFARECPGTITGYAFPDVEVGESIALCYPTEPAGATEEVFTIAEDGNCLCTCEEVLFEATDAAVDIHFFDCETGDFLRVTIDPDNSHTACVAQNSYFWTNGAGTATATINGPCDGDGI